MKNQLARIILPIILLFIGLYGCTKEDTDGKVLIRVENLSEFDYRDVIVITGSNENNFGNIASRTASEYKIFESAYRYGYIELKIDNKTYLLQPIDYMGESLLDPGKYTYKVNAEKTNNQYGDLSLDFEKD